MDDMNDDIVGDDAVSLPDLRMLTSSSMKFKTRLTLRRSKPRVGLNRSKRKTT